MNEDILSIGDLSSELDKLAKEDILSLKPVAPSKGLTEDQTKALEAINEWLYRVYKNRDEQNFFALRGSAGTGKTTLLDALLKSIKHPYVSRKIVVCAPTHKAKKVLQNKTKWRYSETLQALIGIKMDVSLEDFDVNNPAFEQIGERKMKEYDLVVIDESSMVNPDLFNTIVDVAKGCGTKVLFVGDPKQLNPVKYYSISPALVTPVNQYELTQIVRQGADNPLILILDALRKDIEHNTSTFMDIIRANPINLNSKGEGYVTGGGVEFSEALKAGITSDEFKEDKNHCRYISWTNVSITDSNRWIRNKAIGHDRVVNPTLELDEVILAYKTVTDGDDTILTNSDDYIVENIQESLISDYKYPLKTYFAHLRGIDTGVLSKVNILIKDSDNYANYAYVFKEQLETAKRVRGRKGWGKFYEFKNKILILENIYEGQELLIKKDIDYGYGITIHKSQGSTYNTVFVNGKDINKNMTDSERKRLWYVALSRASNKAYINLQL